MGRMIDANALVADIAKERDKIPVTDSNGNPHWHGKAMRGGIQKVLRCVNDAPAVDPVHAAGGCYCRECMYQEDCFGQIGFWGRDLVLEQNNYEYHKLDFCSYGRRKEVRE